jgi:SAM-dependent methyltransferase
MPTGEPADNKRFYDGLWAGVKLQPPERFNTWPLLSHLATNAERRLEVGPGMRPRLPITGTHFADVSAPAMRALRGLGGHAVTSEAGALPYGNERFDVVCAFDLIEHTRDDHRALGDLARVLRGGGTLVLSVPLYMRAWTFFDDAVGHYRRYEPDVLEQALADHGLVVERSAAYGMQPRNTLLLKFGMWWVRNHYEHAMAWYNRVFMPIALRRQKPLTFLPGLPRDPHVDEVVLVCRRARAAALPASARAVR